MKAKKLIFYNSILLFSAIIIIITVGFYVALKLTGTSYAATGSEDNEPPIISNITPLEITATSASIVWNTDEEADSLVNYGLDKNYCTSRDPYFDKINHKIIVKDLLPSSTYYYRIISTDDGGNQRISNDYSFKTLSDRDLELGNLEKSLGVVCDKEKGINEGGNQEEKPKEEISEDKLYPESDVEEKNLVQEVLEKISQVQEEKSLEIIEKHIQNIATDVASPLTIILDNAEVEVGTDYAIVIWGTNKEANSTVWLVEEDNYDDTAEKPYSWSEGDPDESVLEHTVEINGLKSATTYHYSVQSKGALGQEATSEDRVFTTKSILPIISSLSVTKVEEESATISFLTNIPTSAIIEYTNLNTGLSKLEGQSSYTTSHRIQLKNLTFDTYYSAIVTVENEQGEKAKSNPLTFITTRDEFPPLIAKVNTESTLYPGSDNKVQTIVSWNTDEPSVCQLFYHRGIVSLEDVDKLPEETDYTSKHVQVVTNFLPANVYKFWIICNDHAKNASKSDDFTMLTPSQEESIIDIILKNFEGTFGWVKKIKL